MKVILVEDDRIALMGLQRALSAFKDIEVVGMFTDGKEAVASIAALQPDAVFLDIMMPEMDGLEARSLIAKLCPKAAIIFVTGDKSYAIDAFEHDALDYILKPFSRARLSNTIDRLREQLLHLQIETLSEESASQPEEQSEERLTFYCMKFMRIQHPGQRQVALKWRTVKVKELFAYLFHHRGKWISSNTLLELLWPDVEEHKGLTNLQTSIYRIRKMHAETIGGNFFHIKYQNRGYILETNQLRIDSEDWEQRLRQAGELTNQSAAEHHKLLLAYEGDYLGKENYAWAEIERQRLKSIWLLLAQKLVQFYNTRGMDSRTKEIYRYSHQMLGKEVHLNSEPASFYNQ